MKKKKKRKGTKKHYKDEAEFCEMLFGERARLFDKGIEINCYAIIGNNETIEDCSGLIRSVKDKDGLVYQRLDKNGDWMDDNSIAGSLYGYSNDAEPITIEDAEKIRKRIKKAIRSRKKDDVRKYIDETFG